MTHWGLALYERYVQLYGDPIEQPMRPRPDEPHDQQLAPSAPLPMKKDPTD